MKKRYLSIVILLTITVLGCRKYVEIEQMSTRTFKYTTDFRYAMNNNTVLESNFSYPILSGDDATITDATRILAFSDVQSNVYSWAEKYTSDTQSDADWDRLYKTIYTCNEVIGGVRNSLNGSAAEKEKIYAEALVHRAYAYLVLINMYARQYNPATASTDLGVPLLVTSNLFTSLKRAPIADVYAQIITDLNSSISRLPSLPDYNVRPAKVSSYAILAKTYLNMRDFSKANLYADSALNLQNTLLDLKTYESASGTIPQRLKDSEVILSKVAGVTITGVSISDELLTAMGTNDLRYKIFTNTRSAVPSFLSQFSTAFTGRAYQRYLLNGEFSIINGPSVPEMMLIKAECLARAGNINDALTQVNNLRRKRFSDANYVALTATTAADALNIVVAEKRKEFVGTGIRWFDQKRLNLDPAFAQTKTRVFKGITYTLEANSNRYFYPIGDRYILLNPELEQNPR